MADLDLNKWPRWALIAAACIGIVISGAVGSAIGVKVVDHEIRIVKIEESRFTDEDGRELVREMKSDLRDIKTTQEMMQRDIAVLKSRGTP